jgi:hypothetical protein
MKPETMEQFGFNPVKNMFPIFDCRICHARNPLVFFAPKPQSGYDLSIWHCVCFDCARDKLHWMDNKGNLKKGITV